MDQDKAAVEAYRKALQGRSKTGMTQALFQKTKLTSHKLDIINEEEKLVPFRNTACIQLECIYTQEELIQKYFELGKNEKNKFQCRFCATEVELRNFYIDDGLNQIISEVWTRYNLTSNNAYQLDLDSKMSWVPNLHATADRENQIQNFDRTKFPKIEDFNFDSIGMLLNAYVPLLQKVNQPDKPLYNYFESPVMLDDVQLVYQSFTVKPYVMKFAIKYLDHVLRQTAPEMKVYYSVYVVFAIDPKTQIGNYKALPDFQNFILPSMMPSFNYFAFVYFYQQTWILVLANVQNSTIHVFNLTKGNQTLHTDFIRILFQDQTGITAQMSVTVMENFLYLQKDNSSISGCTAFYILLNLRNDPNLTEIQQQTMTRSLIEEISVKTLTWTLLETAQIAGADKQNEPEQKPQPEQPPPRRPTLIKQPTLVKYPDENPGQIDPPIMQPKRNPTYVPRNNDFYYDQPPPQAPTGGRRIQDYNSQMTQKWEFPQEDDKDSFHDLLNNMKDGNTSALGNSQNEQIKLSKAEFVQLLQKLRQDVIKEIQYPAKSIADEFIQKKLPETDLEIQVETYNSEITGNPLQKTLSMDQRELKRLLQKYQQEVRDKVRYEQRHGIKDPNEEEKELSDYMQNYQAFQSVLWYYYNYNPDMYQKLIDEYNHRFHNMLLEKLGLGDFYSPNNPLGLSAVASGGVRGGGSKGGLNSSMNNASFNVSKDSGRYDPNINNMSNNNMRSVIKGSGQRNRRGSNENFLPGQVYNLNGDSYQHSEITQNFSTYENQLMQSHKDGKEIVAKRYERDIGKSQYVKFQTNGILSENMLNFFIRFVDERHNSNDVARQKMYNNRILFFTTSFYQYLTDNDPTGRQLNFDVVQHYTQSYTGRGNTIFDVFDQILIPISIGSSEIHLGVIDLTDQQFILYETCISKVHEKDPLNSPAMINMMQFIQKETSQKLMKTFNLLKWSFLYGDCSKVSDFQYGPLYVSYFMYLMSNQHTNFQVSQSIVLEFQDQLSSLFLQIGITQNLQNEIQSLIENTPL